MIPSLSPWSQLKQHEVLPGLSILWQIQGDPQYRLTWPSLAIIYCIKYRKTHNCQTHLGMHFSVLVHCVSSSRVESHNILQLQAVHTQAQQLAMQDTKCTRTPKCILKSQDGTQLEESHVHRHRYYRYSFRGGLFVKVLMSTVVYNRTYWLLYFN